MNRTILFAGLIVGFMNVTAVFAKDVVMKTEKEREAYIRRADVWLSPPWITSDFRFSDTLDVFHGPEVSGIEKYLTKEAVLCQMTDELAVRAGSGGKTPKFYCQLLAHNPVTGLPEALNDKKTDIKVKFSPNAERTNGELFGEVIATRLLWALGFQADRMFPVNKVYCYGCTENPFRSRKVDAASLQTPRLFSTVAIERKAKGDELVIEKLIPANDGYPDRGRPVRPGKVVEVSGWGLDEVMRLTSLNPKTARTQKIQRGAIGLLAAFMQHVDNKAENQRLLCPEGVDGSGVCRGQVVLMLQDVGATFGKGFSVAYMNIVKAELQNWVTQPVWKVVKPGVCKANIDFWFETSVKDPDVSEESRQFLLKLLAGFSEGPKGYQRVLDLFRAARIELRSGTPAEWAEAFIKKVEEIRYPLGPSHPAFKCPSMSGGR